MEAVVGTNNLSKGGQYYKVRNYVVHQNYSERWKQNDIAIARIETKFEFNDKVQPIAYSAEETPDHSDVQFAGYT